MKKPWLSIIKPKGALAKYFFFAVLAVIIGLGASGYLDVIKANTDTDTLSIGISDYNISLYDVIKGVSILILIFWTAAIITDFAGNRINKFTHIRAANRSLIVKTAQIAIYFISSLLALDILGIDLTTLTVFSGALGIGLGFGLQKITSNFFSGIILLLEKSVEQDDLVEMSDGIIGFVRKSSARYTIIETFDGREIIVPNEDFIVSRVINMTYSNTRGRVEIPIGVAYSSDIEQARDIILEAARTHPSSIEEPAPACYLRNFGDSSVDFVLHFWVGDVTLGRWRPQSEVMFEIWRQFKQHGIEIPFPQRDLHLRTSDMKFEPSHSCELPKKQADA
jgi:small-conductance mechanosensitive channel